MDKIKRVVADLHIVEPKKKEKGFDFKKGKVLRSGLLTDEKAVEKFNSTASTSCQMYFIDKDKTSELTLEKE